MLERGLWRRLHSSDVLRTMDLFRVTQRTCEVHEQQLSKMALEKEHTGK